MKRREQTQYMNLTRGKDLSAMLKELGPTSKVYQAIQARITKVSASETAREKAKSNRAKPVHR